MDCVEGCYEFWVKFQGVSMEKREGVIWLQIDVYTNHIEPCSCVSGARATGAAKEIKQPRSPPESSEEFSIQSPS